MVFTVIDKIHDRVDDYEDVPETIRVGDTYITPRDHVRPGFVLTGAILHPDGVIELCMEKEAKQ